MSFLYRNLKRDRERLKVHFIQKHGRGYSEKVRSQGARPIFLHACATCSELPSNIKTLIQTFKLVRSDSGHVIKFRSRLVAGITKL